MSIGVYGDANQGEISMATGHPLLLYTNNDPDKGVEIQVDGDLNIKDGNLVVASGHGIDFSATSGTGTSELLDDYEEGTWTPRYTAASGGNLGGTQQSLGRFTKVGNIVDVRIYIFIANINVSGKSGAVHISGLPFTVADVGASSAAKTSTTQSTATFGAFSTAPTHATAEVATTQISLFKPLASQAENKLQVSDFATGGGNRNYLRFNMTYEAS